MPPADDPRLYKCGFAKLLGPDVEVYMRNYEVNIGRKSKSTNLDVVLGDNMNISRHHATIRYNFETACFELVVHGKNGVTVQGTLHTPNGPPVVLHSQDRLQVGDHVFHFLLPKDISKLKSNKRKRSSSQGATKRTPTAQAAYSGDEEYSEDYGAQYRDEEYTTHQRDTHTPQPNGASEDGYDVDEDEDYDEEEEPAAPAYHNRQQRTAPAVQNEDDLYGDEDEEQYEDHYARPVATRPPAACRPPPARNNHRRNYRSR